MADVRAMLRAERAARAPPKARKPAPVAAASSVTSKKRKASDEEDEDSDSRKRARPQNEHLPAGFYDEGVDEEQQAPPLDGFVPAEDNEPAIRPVKDTGTSKTASNGTSKSQSAQDETIDEAEWAAFQEFTNSVPTKQKSAAFDDSNATISAPALSTAVAAQQAKDAEAQSKRSRRDEEMEEEKEEAAERLEEEFEVMENLEDRIRKLKEKRERLRTLSRTSADGVRPAMAAEVKAPEKVVEEENEESEDDVDEFDGWRFGSR